MSETPWLLRPYDPAQDQDALFYMLGVSYTRSRAGQRAGASSAGGSKTLAERLEREKAPDPNIIAKQRAFLDAHRPIWAWLMEHATVTLAVDPELPRIIWAWTVLSDPNVIHAVGCKRSLADAGLSADVIRDMLGDRLKAHQYQVCTLELPQMRTRGTDAIGIDRPREWSMDPTWLLTRMQTQIRMAA